jgi:predicted ATPase
MQVPATLQAVLAARIDRLPPEEKDLLQTAAAIGAALQAIGNEVRRPLVLTLLAEAYGGIGQGEEGLNVLADALAGVENTG